MNPPPDIAAAIVEFYGHIDVYLLIVTRLAGFFIILPVISGTSVPMQIRTLFCAAAGLLVYSTGAVSPVWYEPTVFGYAGVILREFITGFLLGFAVYIIFTAILFAGQLIDFQIGFSMVSILSPMTQIQIPVTGNLLYFFYLALFVQTGGLNAFVYAICASYAAIPAGGAHLLSNQGMTAMLIKLTADLLVIGLQIAMPILGSLLIIDIALGILVKAVPQMNVFVVGMPMKLLAGLVLLYLLVPSFADLYQALFDRSYDALRGMEQTLGP